MNHPRKRSNPDATPKQPWKDDDEKETKPEALDEDKGDGEYTYLPQSSAPYSGYWPQPSEYSRTPRSSPSVPSFSPFVFKGDPPALGGDPSQTTPGPSRNVPQTDDTEQYSTSADVQRAGSWMPPTLDHPQRFRIGDEQNDSSSQDSDSDTQATRRRRFKARQSMLSQEYKVQRKDKEKGKKKSEGTDVSAEQAGEYPFDSDEESLETQSTAWTEDGRPGWPYGGGHGG